MLIPVSDESGELARQPQILPGGEAVLFTVSTGLGTWDQGKVVIQSLVTGERQVLVEGGTDARYVHTGHVVYAHGGTLFALPVDVESLEVMGGPVSMVEGIAQNLGSGVAHSARPKPGPLLTCRVRAVLRCERWFGSIERDKRNR